MSQIIGSWTCPSGNRVNAECQGAGSDVQFYWDVPPPLPPEDHAYYLQVIRPQTLRRVFALSQTLK